MKKLIVILLLLGSVYVGGAQDIQYFPHDSTWINLVNGKKSILSFTTCEDIEYARIDGAYVYLSINDTRKTNLMTLIDGYISLATIETDGATGYRFFMTDAKGFSSIKPFRTFILNGNDLLLTAHYSYNVYEKLTFDGCVTNFSIKATMEQGLKQRRSTLYDRPLNYKYLDTGIASIISSSYLTETVGGKVLDYKPEYMMNRICKAADGWEFYPEFDNFMRCWAEGVPGDGIGEWVKVDFTRASDEMMILNGYIDFGNMLAYKNNNRLWRIRIDSDHPKFSIEYAFEDFVVYHTVKLPAATNSVKITILDVYKGAKYSDTCVTAITLPQERWRTKEAEEREVREYLESLGVLEYVRKYKKGRE